MNFNESSNWNERNELRCLLIFKKLELENFPRGKQTAYCKEIVIRSGLDEGNLSAKVSDFKSVAGINKPSHNSSNTINAYKKYNHFSIKKLEEIINNF